MSSKLYQIILVVLVMIISTQGLPCDLGHSLHKKATVHQVTTMLTTSSVVVTWWIVAFLPSVCYHKQSVARKYSRDAHLADHVTFIGTDVT